MPEENAGRLFKWRSFGTWVVRIYRLYSFDPALTSRFLCEIKRIPQNKICYCHFKIIIEIFLFKNETKRYSRGCNENTDVWFITLAKNALNPITTSILIDFRHIPVITVQRTNSVQKWRILVSSFITLWNLHQMHNFEIVMKSGNKQQTTEVKEEKELHQRKKENGQQQNKLHKNFESKRCPSGSTFKKMLPTFSPRIRYIK